MTIQETKVVTPLRPARAKRADNAAALHQRRSRAKRKRVTPVPVMAITQVTHPGKPSEIKADVTVARGEARGETRSVTAPSRRVNYALVVIAYGFFALASQSTYGTPRRATRSPTAALGVLPEAVVFFLPTCGAFAFISVFALTNSMRMASIIAADQATARANRQAEAVRVADHALSCPRQEGRSLRPWSRQVCCLQGPSSRGHQAGSQPDAGDG
jgi:hypothetical protein